MAETITKKSRVKQFPKAINNAEPAESAPAPPEAAPQPPALEKRGPGRPKANETAVPKTMTFFQRLQRIDPKDWGTRAQIKVYRIYPVTNRLVNADNKFICIYGNPGEPPLTEEQLKVDHGSGKYRLYLTYKPAGPGETKEMDSVEVDILDPAFPPKIPTGEWMDDPRNKQWAWGKPKDVQPGAQPTVAPHSTMSEVAEILRASNEIRKDAREEFQKPGDSDDLGVFGMAQAMLKLQVENPMVSILMSRMEAMDKANEAARAREFELQKELRAMAQPKSDSGGSGGLVEQLKALADAKEILKSLLGIKEESAVAATVVKSRMSGTMEFLKEFTPQILNAPVLVNLSQALLNRFTTLNPAVPMPAQQNGATPAAAQGLEVFIRDTVTPAMLSYLEEGGDGTRFAEWLYAGFPERLKPIQNITHNQMPGMVGKDVIVNFYRHSAVWPRIAGPQSMKLDGQQRVPLPVEEYPAREAAFQNFVEEFCKYDPDKEDEPDTTHSGETEEKPEEVDV